MSNREPFSLDVEVNAEGARLMLHVRGENAADFARNIADARRIANGPFSGALSTLDPSAIEHLDINAPATPAPTHAPPSAPGSGWTCPEHGQAKPSKFGGALYCPAKVDAETFCKRKEELRKSA